jgi:hypothetical protein
MGKYSHKQGGKEVGQAAVYAEPHTMAGKKVKPESVKAESGAKRMDTMNISVGGTSRGNYKEAKTSGVKIRGTGAATKGLLARGPMG